MCQRQTNPDLDQPIMVSSRPAGQARYASRSSGSAYWRKAFIACLPKAMAIAGRQGFTGWINVDNGIFSNIFSQNHFERLEIQ